MDTSTEKLLRQLARTLIDEVYAQSRDERELRLYTAAEAAEIMGLSEDWLKRAATAKLFPHHLFPSGVRSKLRFTLADMKAGLAGIAVEAHPEYLNGLYPSRSRHPGAEQQRLMRELTPLGRGPRKKKTEE